MNKKFFGHFLFFATVIFSIFILTYKKNVFQTNSVNRFSPTPTLVQSTQEIINNAKVVNGMKRFVSNIYKFSISYPADWQLLDEPSLNGIEIQKINSSGKGFSISIRVNDNPQKLTIYQYAKSQALKVYDNPQKVTFANLDGYRLQYLPEGLLTTIYLPYKKSEKVLYFFAGGDFDKSSKTINYYNNIVNNVLNSIKLEE